MEATQEQLNALTTFLTGKNFVIEAAAGSGKTSTLKLLANYGAGRHGLYVAFNKSVQQEAEPYFAPFGVNVRTAHSLAYHRFGKPRHHRLQTQYLHWTKKAEMLGVTSRVTYRGTQISRPVLIELATATLNQFCQSANTTITSGHVNLPPGILTDLTEDETEHLTNLIIRLTEHIWEDMVNPAGNLPVTHQSYLKMFQLSRPVIPADYILLDEAQDLDPVTIEIIKQQDAQIVVVGDPNQQIYGWRGAVNAMDMFGGPRTTLTQSFRFGEAIAEEANLWLEKLGTTMRVKGLPGKHSTVGRVPNPEAVITRTNAGLIGEMVTEQLHRKHVAIAGEHKLKELEKLTKAAHDLQEKGKTAHPELAGFKTWSDVVEFSRTGEGGTLQPLVSVIEKWGVKKVSLSIATVVPAHKADVVLSTAHVAKGLEWGSVRAGEDFRKKQYDPDTETPHEELRLGYVVTTRAKNQFDNTNFNWVRI